VTGTQGTQRNAPPPRETVEQPFVKSFDSVDEYERWRRAQTNPWYR
jgi:hypothetical protein